MLLLAMENGMNTESDIPTFSSGFGALLAAFADDAFLGALGVHSNILDIKRLYITSYKCLDLEELGKMG